MKLDRTNHPASYLDQIPEGLVLIGLGAIVAALIVVAFGLGIIVGARA